MRTVLRDGIFFTAEGRVRGDLLIEEGRIAEVGEVTGKSDEEIQLGGKWVWPGVIDAHVHFREPGLTQKEDWASGSRAAVSGGVTTVFDMPNTVPAMTTRERLEEKRVLADQKSLVNYGLFFGAGPDNLEEIEAVRGVPGVKIFMADSTGDLLVDRREDLERIFAVYDGQISVHAESQVRMEERQKRFRGRFDPAVHSVIRDAQTAAEGVALAAALALRYERNLHVLHVSTRAELKVLEVAREEGVALDRAARITAEVCPHHLFLDTTAYERWGTRVQMNPPLREPADREAMWLALTRGELDMVATDHAPHLVIEKARPYGEAPSGVPGVETVLPLMLDAAFRGLCEYEDVLRWLAHRPAEIYGLRDRGRLEVGNWADLVCIDPRMMRTVEDRDQRSRCGWSPWSTRVVVGWPIMTWVNGTLVFRREGDGNGEILTHEAVGQEGEFPR